VSDVPPFARVSWPVRTSRLAIRPATLDDFPRLYEIRAAPGVSDWLTHAPASYDDYAERNGTEARLGSTLVMEHDGSVVGDLYLAVESPWSQLEAQVDAAGTLGVLGWCVDPSYAGQGFATEAAAALLRVLFEDLEVRRAVAGAFADNVASLRVMEKIGMRRESTELGASLHRDRGWLDAVGYGILADEWRARHG
jgi:RimJ/RimL family protein N-acetyltransferase